MRPHGYQNLTLLFLTCLSTSFQIGWPSSLPTSEKGTFVKSVLREKVARILEHNVVFSYSFRNLGLITPSILLNSNLFVGRKMQWMSF